MAASGASHGAGLILINGTQVQPVTAGGGVRSAVVEPAARGLAGSVLRLQLGDHAYAIPGIALPYLGRGLDPSLFDLGALRASEQNGRLPVQIRYTGALPALPGITITGTGSGPGARTAQGYLTAASAKVFGAALTRQFTADHARASYGSDGWFAAGVSVALAGPAGPAGAGGRAGPKPHRFVMHNLTVTGSNLRGRPDNGDMVFAFNVDNVLRFGDPVASNNFFYHGAAKFSLPAGHYWAIGDFFSFSGGTVSERLSVLPQFTVRGNTTVHIAERRASSQITAVTPRHSSVISTTLELRRPGRSGPTDTFEWVDQGLSLWVSPTHQRPTVGKLQTFTAQQRFTRRQGTRPPTEYNLVFQAIHGLIPPQRHVLTVAHLARVDELYHQAVPYRGAELRFGLYRIQAHDFLLEPINPFRLPRYQTEYMSASPSLAWFSQIFQSYQTLAGGQSEAPRVLVAGLRVTDRWNAYPLHEGVNARLADPAYPIATLPSASRQGNTLTLDVTPFSDSTTGHTGSGFFGGFSRYPKLSGTYEIDQNGVKIAGGNAVTTAGGAPDLLTSAHLAAHPATIRFVLDAARTGKNYPLSVASQTVWTWRSSRQPQARLPGGWRCAKAPSQRCAVQQMMTLGYQVAGLSLEGRAAPGAQSLDLSAGQLQLTRAARVTSAGLQVSFDDGVTWQQAQLTRLGNGQYRATFTAPASSNVTLRASARDAAGSRITETILRAYRTRA